MGLKKILVGAASVMALTAGVANADFARQGWYYGLEAGVVHVNDTSFNTQPTKPISLDNGPAVLGTIGYDLTNSNWRFEAELGYRKNEGDMATRQTGRGVVSLTEWTGFINAIYDVKVTDKWGIALGAGVGVDDARWDAVDGTESNDKVFAMQGIAGLTYRLSQHWDLALNYRYLQANEPKLKYDVFAGADVMDLQKHTLTIGLRYGYDEPPAAPVVAAPPAPPPAVKQFIVFFGFNKCNITAEADAVLSEAASAAKSQGSASVRIVGHTDTSGSNAYNQKLSECRANATKTNLVGKGVSEGAISTSGKGETELMVQTGDAVKEPQNRRATIDLN